MIKFSPHMDKIIRRFVICDVRKLTNHYEKILESCRNQFQTWLWKSLNKFLLKGYLVCLRFTQRSSVLIRFLVFFQIGIFILIQIWSLVFDSPMIQILALYLDLRCKEHPCPLSPHLGLWRMLQAP